MYIVARSKEKVVEIFSRILFQKLAKSAILMMFSIFLNFTDPVPGSVPAWCNF
jgi:hypothetical protein